MRSIGLCRARSGPNDGERWPGLAWDWRKQRRWTGELRRMVRQLFRASFAAMSNPNRARVRIYIPLVPPDNQSCSGPPSSQRRWTDDRFKLSVVDGPLPSGQHRVIPKRSRSKACRSPPGSAFVRCSSFPPIRRPVWRAKWSSSIPTSSARRWLPTGWKVRTRCRSALSSGRIGSSRPSCSRFSWRRWSSPTRCCEPRRSDRAFHTRLERRHIVTERLIDLDQRRGLSAPRATESRCERLCTTLRCSSTT